MGTYGKNQVYHLLTKNLDARYGVGLINTDNRIQRHYGQGLHIQSEIGTGTTVSFLVTH